MALTPTKQRIPIDMGLLEILNHRLEQLADDPEGITEGRIWHNTTEHRTKRFEDGEIVPFFSKEDAEKLASFESAAEQAQADADAANQLLEDITNDNLLTRYEKPAIHSQYDIIVGERSAIDALATSYGITTEKTNYDNAVIALVNYVTTFSPAIDNYSGDTVINGVTLRTLFANVYTTRQLLFNAFTAQAQADSAEAKSIADNAQTAADQAVIDIANAIVIVEGVSDDGILAAGEKPAIVQQYNIIQAEFTGILDQADTFGITTERTAYYNAVNALSVYIEALDPAYDDYSQGTVIVRATFNSAFETYYGAKQTLLNKIAEVAKEAGDTAAIIAASKKRHFIVEPTTPYNVGDLWSNATDLYRCIVERLVGAFNAADWEVATHYDRTKTIIDGGLITTGRIEVGGGVLGDANAGMNGSVSGTPTTDIRFWAGSNYAGRATAPWRVQNDGTFYATQGYIGGWHIDSDSIHTGTKKTGDGFAAAPGDITIKSDGSIHAKNFYINADGEVAFSALNCDLETVPTTGGTYDGAIRIAGNHIWENTVNGDNGGIFVNYKGYNGGVTKQRFIQFGNGKNATVMIVGAASIGGVEQPFGGVLIDGILLLPTLPTSAAGLGAGQIYRDGAGSGATLKIN